MAIAERHSGKDFVGVYDVAAGYQLLRVSKKSRRPKPDIYSISHYRLPMYKD